MRTTRLGLVPCIALVALVGVVGWTGGCADDDDDFFSETREITQTFLLNAGTGTVAFTEDRDVDVRRNDMRRLEVRRVTVVALNDDLSALRDLRIEGKDLGGFSFSFEDIARFQGVPAPGTTFLQLAVLEDQIASFVNGAEEIEMKFHISADSPSVPVQLLVTFTLEYHYF